MTVPLNSLPNPTAAAHPTKAASRRRRVFPRPVEASRYSSGLRCKSAPYWLEKDVSLQRGPKLIDVLDDARHLIGRRGVGLKSMRQTGGTLVPSGSSPRSALSRGDGRRPKGKGLVAASSSHRPAGGRRPMRVG